MCGARKPAWRIIALDSLDLLGGFPVFVLFRNRQCELRVTRGEDPKNPKNPNQLLTTDLHECGWKKPMDFCGILFQLRKDKSP